MFSIFFGILVVVVVVSLIHDDDDDDDTIQPVRLHVKIVVELCATWQHAGANTMSCLGANRCSDLDHGHRQAR